MPMTKAQHLDGAVVPKRILALDGGGIRGVLTLEYLGVIEAMLRQRAGRDDFRLCDYFDLIGGTSTGSIIAAALACGMSVGELKQLYREIGKTVFEPRFCKRHPGPEVSFRAGAAGTRCAARSGRHARQRSHPHGPHDHDQAPRHRQSVATPQPSQCSLCRAGWKLLLTHVVRASTAAPTYFEPQSMEISSRDGTVVKGAFVDGGVSPFNDPALQLLMVAALQGHGFRWQTGADNLLLISDRHRNVQANILHRRAAEHGARPRKACARCNRSWTIVPGSITPCSSG